MEKEKDEKLPVGITKEMVADAKVKYGADKVKYVEILKENSDDVDIVVLACVPSRHITGQWRRYCESDPKKADDILVKNCLLSHKEEVLANDYLFSGALNGIAELIPMRKAVVKNC
ncbi:MAG: hypothetical protein FWC39_08000 [Bacteroidetes bacterium]|nr:hypothetical protein [Bacteroidota bacterium]